MSNNVGNDKQSRLKEIEKLQLRLRKLRNSKFEQPETACNSQKLKHIFKNNVGAPKSHLCDDSSRNVTHNFTDNVIKSASRLKNNGLKYLIPFEWDDNNAYEVNASVQTSGNELFAESSKGKLNPCLELRNSSREKRPVIRELLEGLLERLNWCLLDSDRVGTPDHHLGNRTPRRVKKRALCLNEQKETLNVISSAARVSVGRTGHSLLSDINKKRKSSIDQVNQLINKYILDRRN